MISFDDYTSHDGLGLAHLVALKEVSAKELAETALAAIEKLNPHINAVLQQFPKQSNNEAQSELLKGPFSGVPFLIRDYL